MKFNNLSILFFWVADFLTPISKEAPAACSGIGLQLCDGKNLAGLRAEPFGSLQYPYPNSQIIFIIGHDIYDNWKIGSEKIKSSQNFKWIKKTIFGNLQQKWCSCSWVVEMTQNKLFLFNWLIRYNLQKFKNSQDKRNFESEILIQNVLETSCS